jgi:putative transposase
MKNDNVIPLETPAKNEDLLTHLLRQGARELLTKAVQAELTEFLSQYEDVVDDEGRRAVVRNGYLPERELMTGLGPVDIHVPKTRDRSGEGRHFSSALLPPYIKRTKSIETLLPWLYLKGISTGDFSEALATLLGEDAKGLSAGTISRLKQVWHEEYGAWCKRDLSHHDYVYLWADGVYFNIRGDESRQCILVIIGVTAQGNKEFLAITDGYRESEQSWSEVLLDLKNRGMNQAKLAIGDGALGFWKAMQKVFGKTRHQRCWVHKTANVLNKMPKSIQPKAKQHLQDIWMAETRKDAEKALLQFLTTYQDKYPKACECLEKDQEQMLAFYDFPAEHWVHIRTSNPIESTFATVRLRTAKTRGCVSRTTILTMVFRLGLSAEKGWRKLRGFKRLAEVINGVKFIDGIHEKTIEEQRKAT